MILTKNALKIFKLSLHDEKTQVLNVVKFSNKGMFYKNREVTIFVSRVSSFFRKNSIFNKFVFIKEKIYFSIEKIKQIHDSIKKDSSAGIFGECVYLLDVKNDEKLEKHIDPEYNFDTDSKDKENKENKFYLNFKRFVSLIEYINIIGGKTEDLTVLDFCLTDKNLKITYENKETGQKIISYISKSPYAETGAWGNNTSCININRE